MLRTLIALLGVALLASLTASAQAATNSTITYETPEQMNQSLMHPIATVQAGVGVANFDQGLAAASQPGAGYSATIDLSPTRYIGLEVGYLGAVNTIRSQFSPNGSLVTNQVGGDFRFNFLSAFYDLQWNMKPYTFVGAAYQNVAPRGFVPGVTSANAFALPVGAGVEVDAGGGYVVGVRYTYNLLYGAEDQFGGRKVDDWLASISVGGRFGL